MKLKKKYKFKYFEANNGLFFWIFAHFPPNHKLVRFSRILSYQNNIPKKHKKPPPPQKRCTFAPTPFTPTAHASEFDESRIPIDRSEKILWSLARWRCPPVKSLPSSSIGWRAPLGSFSVRWTVRKTWCSRSDLVTLSSRQRSGLVSHNSAKRIENFIFVLIWTRWFYFLLRGWSLDKVERDFGGVKTFGTFCEESFDPGEGDFWMKLFG